jgi:Niemann-Pick C1 protein
MNITQSKQVTLPSGKTAEAVVSVDYYVSEDFSYGMFNSCKDVQMPSANQKALDILCGMPAAQCTPQKWLNFMGDTSNGHTPFKIKFTIDNHPRPPAGSNITIIPMNVTYTKCSEGAFNKSACSCQDCPVTCVPLPTPPSPEKEATILGYDSWYFVMCVLCIAFVIFFSMMYILWYKVIKHDNPHGRHVNMDQNQKDIDEYNSHENGGLKPVDTYSVPMIELKNISYLENLGAAMERFLQRNFTRWGTCCARHPIIVIVVGIIIAGGLSAGITMFKVTTNPVELWSSKSSRARTEKDYFDSHFG